jgi:hypothetical protein
VPPSLESLRESLVGRALPGGSIRIERHESAIADHAVRATDDAGAVAHPIWFVIASLRGMGITVEELCELCGQAEGDTLLFGGVEVEQRVALEVGAEYVTDASVVGVERKTTRSGNLIDSVSVVVRMRAGTELHGDVTSHYLFKRA